MFLIVRFLEKNQSMSWIDLLNDRISKSNNVKVIEPPILYEQTQEIIKSIRAFYKNDFMVYWGANNSSIAPNDVVVFHEILKNKKSTNLCLFIKSTGGSGKVALRLIHLLRTVYEKITVLVPMECASAATMLALGADEIKMGPLSYLTAIDTSIIHELSPVDADGDHVSVNQNELDRVMKLWNKEKRKNEKNPYKELYKYIHPLVFGAVDRASSLSIKLTNEILSYHMKDEEKINSISNHLNSEYPSHGYPITSLEAKALGLNVELLEDNVHEKLIELNHLYSEMAQRAYTDYNEYKYHDNQIFKVIETETTQVYYQKNKDMIWRKDDKQWVEANDKSSWVKVENGDKKIFHIR